MNNSRAYDKHGEQMITGKVEIKKTIFGVNLLSKTNNRFIQEAREQNKRNMKLGEELMKDKIEEFRQLRQNIDQLTPKTVSSHGSDLVEMVDVDYNDPDSFRKAQLLLEQKQREREQKKKEKENEENSKMSKDSEIKK